LYHILGLKGEPETELEHVAPDQSRGRAGETNV
jgi:hypothetical protein